MQKDVLWLDVAMDHALPVRIVERARNLRSNADRIAHRQLLLARKPITQRFARHKRHHVKDGAVHLPRVVQRENVRMLQVRGGLDLHQEPLGANHRGEFGA